MVLVTGTWAPRPWLWVIYDDQREDLMTSPSFLTMRDREQLEVAAAVTFLPTLQTTMGIMIIIMQM
jgi:hypothetical protein